MDTVKKYGHVIILVMILLLAGMFFFGGNEWGLPERLHPDERTIVNPAVGMLERGSYNPDVFYRPDHLLIKLNAGAYTLASLLVGEPVAVLFETRYGLFYHIARYITGMFGMGMVLTAHAIGRHSGRRAGLLAAGAFAFFPMYTEHAHYATPDIPTTFFMLLCIYACMQYHSKPGLKNLAFMALATALFISVKYPGAITCLFIAISIIYCAVRDRAYKRILSHAVISIAMAAGFLFVISPVLFTDFSSVLSAIESESRSVHFGADSFGFFGNMWFYAKNYILSSGIIPLFFMARGIYSLCRRRTLIPLSYSFIYWIALSTLPLHWERWALPMYVSPLLLAALGADWLLGGAFARIGMHWRSAGEETPVDVPSRMFMDAGGATVMLTCLAGGRAEERSVAKAMGGTAEMNYLRSGGNMAEIKLVGGGDGIDDTKRMRSSENGVYAISGSDVVGRRRVGGRYGIPYAAEGRRVAARPSARRRVYAIALIAALVTASANMLLGSAAELLVFLLPDTRIEAMEYCMSNGITEPETLYEGYSPFNMMGPRFIKDEFSWVEGIGYCMDNTGYKYAILSSGMYGRYSAEPAKYQKLYGVMDAIDQRCVLLKGYNVPKQYKAWLDPLSIYRNVSYIRRLLGYGMSGYDIYIYNVTPDMFASSE